jgi:hypothetical protein
VDLRQWVSIAEGIVPSNPTVGGLREKSQQNVGGVLAEEEAVMNVRIALLFSGILIAASTGAGQVAPADSVGRPVQRQGSNIFGALGRLPGPIESALKAKKVPAEVLTINCPMVSIDH